MEKGIEIVECGQQPTGKRLAVIILKREQLLYDIENYCYVEGDMIPEDMQHSRLLCRHLVQDVGQEGNVDRVTRVLDLAHTDVVERLYPFTEHGLRHPAVDDRLRDKRAYGIFLRVPSDYSQTTLNLLGKLIHELMVSLAVADWMSITNPGKEETWRRKAEEVLMRINQVKSQTRGRRRIRPHWIG